MGLQLCEVPIDVLAEGGKVERRLADFTADGVSRITNFKLRGVRSKRGSSRRRFNCMSLLRLYLRKSQLWLLNLKSRFGFDWQRLAHSNLFSWRRLLLAGATFLGVLTDPVTSLRLPTMRARVGFVPVHGSLD